MCKDLIYEHSWNEIYDNGDQINCSWRILVFSAFHCYVVYRRQSISSKQLFNGPWVPKILFKSNTWRASCHDRHFLIYNHCLCPVKVWIKSRYVLLWAMYCFIGLGTHAFDFPYACPQIVQGIVLFMECRFCSSTSKFWNQRLDSFSISFH